jgi:hypothetical protein
MGALMEEDKSVAYVRNKIQMAEMKNQKDDRTGRRLNVKLRRRDFVLNVEKLVISYEIVRLAKGETTPVLGGGQHVVETEAELEEDTTREGAETCEAFVIKMSRITQERVHGWQW